jgi:hypothetical protein
MPSRSGTLKPGSLSNLSGIHNEASEFRLPLNVEGPYPSAHQRRCPGHAEHFNSGDSEDFLNPNPNRMGTE